MVKSRSLLIKLLIEAFAISDGVKSRRKNKQMSIHTLGTKTDCGTL